MIYLCSQQKRRALVLQHPTLNGIDYLEVSDSGPDCGKILQLTLLKDARKANLTIAQIRITGNVSGAQVHPIEVVPASAASPRLVTVKLDAPGDFSTYRCSLVATPLTADPPDGFDPQLATVDFSFKAGCETSGDCAPVTCCPREHAVTPDINYLAKEFDGFAQVMFDRLSVLVPGWNETHASDMGVALVESLAYAADRLSYQQDAVGTEAYIGTARSRISLRRHAKLVDYTLDEGSNARTWIYAEVANGKKNLALDKGTPLYPRVPGLPVAIDPASKLVKQLNGALTFETMQAATLTDEQNEIDFYSWSDLDCCLPKGGTQATLKGRFPSIVPGVVLLFEEKFGPDTGNEDDGDASKRWVVRVTNVQQKDYLNRSLVDPIDGTEITRVWWDPADALPFPLCISSPAKLGVSVARGNMIPADHGVWQDWEELGMVPAVPAAALTSSSCSCGPGAAVDAPRPRFFPKLSKSPLSFVVPLDTSESASAFLRPSGSPRPQLFVRDDRKQDWKVLADLMSSHEEDKVVVAEIERDSSVFLRFGDGQYGKSVNGTASFAARYRVGNGAEGNLGRDTLAHVVTKVDGIVQVRNPLAAQCGRDPESMEHIRQFAPYAFRTQLRAVTEDDYGAMAQRDTAIREARGTLRWTGSWYTAFVSLDAATGDVPGAALVTNTEDRLNLFRMAGVDLQVEGAVIVGLRIDMNICVDIEHFQSDVRDAVTRVFISGNLRDGQPGILDPANFSFGQTIYASPLIAAAQAVEGVSSVALRAFQRMDDPTFDGAAQGFLTLHRVEIARCDNDPNRLDHGVFVLHMDGGK